MEETVVHFMSQALFLVLVVSMPPIAIATFVGLAISLFQALTQIQEQTLGFAIKLVAVILSLIFLGGWLGKELLSFTVDIFSQFQSLVR